MQVETAVVQPLKEALSEEQWRQYNASLAAEAETCKQAEEAAQQQRQLADAQAAEQQAAAEAEAERQSKLSKVGTANMSTRHLLSMQANTHDSKYSHVNIGFSCFTLI